MATLEQKNIRQRIKGKQTYRQTNISRQRFRHEKAKMTADP